MKNICKYPCTFNVNGPQVNAQLGKLGHIMQNIQKLAKKAICTMAFVLCVSSACSWVMRLCSQLLIFCMDYCNVLCMGLPLKSIFIVKIKWCT